MVRLLASLLLFGGCDVALGLDEVPELPTSIDVNGSFVIREVMNDESFNPRVVEHLAPASELAFDAILDDGTESPVTYDEMTGTFSFPLAHEGQSYRLKFTSYDVDSEVQHDARTLSLGYIAAGHLDRRPIAMATVKLSYASAAMVPAQFASTGIYTRTGTSTYVTPTVAFDWRLADPAPAAVTGLLDEQHHDVVYGLEFEVGPDLVGVPGWARIHAVSSKPVTLIPQTSVDVPTPVAVAPNACAHITTSAAEDAVRINAAQPRSYTASRAVWAAYAVPSPDLAGFAGALYIAASGELPAQDLDISPSFLNPFPGSSLVATAVTLEDFVVQRLGTAATNQSNATVVYDVVAPDCTDATPLHSTVALSAAYKLGGTDLEFDNTTITVAGRAPLSFTWELADAGPLDYTVVQLFELTSVLGQTSFIPRWSAAVPRTSAMIDPALLETGHTYMLAVTTALGHPNVSTGDYRTMTFPIDTATLWTHSFIAQ